MNTTTLPTQRPDSLTASMADAHDTRAAKRQQVVPLENETPWRQTITSTAAPPRASMDARSSFANRRRSGLRDYKPPLGPRPPDFINNKRISSDVVNPPPQPASRRSLLPNAASEPFLGLSSRRKTANLESLNNLSSAQARLAASQDITTSPRPAPAISDHIPPGEVNSKMGTSNGPQESDNGQTGVKTPSDPNTSIQNNSAPRASPAKPRNPAVRAAQLSTASASGPSVSTPLTIRTKRQSQIPPSIALDPHQPRKSVGPGLPVQAPKEKVVPEPTHRFPQPASVNGRSPDFTWNFANVKAKPRASMGPSMIMGLQNDSSVESKRNLKARSFHPGLHPPQGVLPGLPGDVSSDELEKTTSRQSQNRPQARRPNGTLSATKRQAALGLARTVSPTDAMKLKRSSVVEKPPPIPARSSTPESSSAMRSGRRSPTPPRQKSATPSSFHTPDTGHGHTAGRSLSSRSSFNSSHPLSSSLQQGPGHGAQAYKSSTIRPKSSDVAASEDLEAVPPVPAIPKAFESPNHTVDEPFFESLETLSPSSRSSQNKQVMNVEATQFLETKTDVVATEPQQPSISGYSAFPMAKEPRSRRRFTLGAKTEQNKSSASTQQSNRQTLQQMRLPPLNLLPLSNPTSEKIASLANAQSQASSNGHTTPPSRRQTTKTPTTPMTASRATFSTFNMLGADDPLSLPPLRINNVSRDIMTEPNAQEESSGSSPTTFLSTSPSGTPPAVSPIPSVPAIPSRANDSALDSQDELAKRREPGDNRASRLISLRTRTFSRSGKESNTSQSANAQQADATNAALPNRRKLSLGWRRSSSKASHSHPNDERLDSSVEKHREMPPPKLPPPTAWNESFSPNSSVGSSKPREIANSEPRKASNGSSIMQEPKRPDLAQSRDLNSSNQDAGPSEQAPAMPEKAANFLNPMHKLLNSRSAPPLASSLHREQEMSRDDLAAEDEMRRLAAKKKEFEAAAKEVDQLRRKASPKDRLSPGQASRAASLNIFERGEIIDYPDIYFCGLKDARKCIGDLTSQGSNFGYDDERGDYNIVMGDHLSYRYEVVDILGKGSFGQVVRCIDHKTGKLVAVKIIRNKKRFHQQALVEVNILQRLRDWDPQSKYSNVEFTQSFYFRGHLCIATELLGMNLYEFVKAHDFRGFSLKLIRRFTRQMLNSLSLLQNNKVIHCDLKPENILLAHPLHSEIKVIDFGSSCFENEKVYTYIQSRFYRSPEVILGMDYGMPIDMWSVGCILAELYTGYPIFPGENEQEQLACIMEVFGPPEKHLIERSSRKKLFFDSLGKPRMTVSSKGKRRRPSSKTLQQAIKCDDEAFLDFLTQCLRWDPERRLKPDRALAHDFVTGLKSRSRTAMSSGTSSPVKRLIPTTQTPGKPTRPLPDPPATSYKNGIAMNSRGPSSSPLKSTIPPRRHSTIAGLQAGAGVKRSSNGSALAPALPRSVSGKPDMASAAAIASLRQR